MKSTKKKKILVLCNSDKSKKNIVFELIKYLSKQKKDVYYFLVLDKNKKIIDFLNKNKKKIIKKNFFYFTENVKKNQFDWLINLWTPIIFKKEFIKKFNNNLNLHPSFLPYNRGKDPYIWSIVDQTPFGVTIHKMNDKIDDGDFYIRKKISLNFPFSGYNLYKESLLEIKKLFLKNWIKIKNNNKKLKKYKKKMKLNYRKDLHKINLINLDDIKNTKIKKFILGALSQDFPSFKQQIRYKKKIYDVKITIKKGNKNKF